MHKIYHHNDMDGEASKSIVLYYLTQKENVDPDDIITISLNHSPQDEEKLSQITESDYVWIMDYSFTLNNVNILRDIIGKCNNKVVWIDHHDTSIDVMKEYKTYADFMILKGCVSKEGSGAYLAWKFCFGPRIPYWVILVSDYDTWKFVHDPETTFFKLAYDMAEFKNVFFYELIYNPDKVKDLNENGRIIKKYIDQDNAKYLRSCGYESSLPDGTPVYVVNKSSNSWIFGDKYNQYQAVVTFTFNGEYYTYSMFSGDPDFDCAKWAFQFGGGGHKGAAGWRSSELMFKKNAREE